jgi:hypothetical protein
VVRACPSRLRDTGGSPVRTAPESAAFVRAHVDDLRPGATRHVDRLCPGRLWLPSSPGPGVSDERREHNCCDEEYGRAQQDHIDVADPRRAYGTPPAMSDRPLYYGVPSVMLGMAAPAVLAPPATCRGIFNESTRVYRLRARYAICSVALVPARVIGRMCRRPFDRRSRRSPSRHDVGRDDRVPPRPPGHLLLRGPRSCGLPICHRSAKRRKRASRRG